MGVLLSVLTTAAEIPSEKTLAVCIRLRMGFLMYHVDIGC